MNQERRTQLFRAKGLINEAIVLLKGIRSKEEFAFDNLSEGLQQTMRGQQMEENIDNFDEAIDGLRDWVRQFDITSNPL